MTFSKDVGMTFGTGKCAYSYVERAKKKSLGETIVMNGVEIKELKEEERYTYLGTDESVSMDGESIVEKVRDEYLRRVKKIWKSELNARNKVTSLIVLQLLFLEQQLEYVIGLRKNWLS